MFSNVTNSNETKLLSCFRKKRLLVLIACFSIGIAAAMNAHAQDSISLPNFIYTPDEMLNFNVQAYLESNAPHLSDQAETITHWSGRSSISPKVILAILEHQAQSLSQEKSANDLNLALKGLSNKNSLKEQISDISTRLATSYYKNVEEKVANPQVQSLKALLSSNLASSATSIEQQNQELKSFTQTFFALFPQSTQPQIETPSSLALSVPSASLLQLPYPVGQSWQTWGGTHTFTGQGSGPRSSLDFRQNRGGFGSNTASLWVSSASQGSAVKHSSCFVEVLAPGGWSTTYYHLDNVQVNTGQSVSRNARLANYANNLDQALCEGGTANGPHLHFSLKLNGAYMSLDGVQLSGYRVQDGRSNYDSNCDYFWLDDNGTRLCEGSAVLNRGVSTSPPPGDGPDLSVSNFQLSSTELTPSASFSISTSISNTGSLESTSTQLKVLVSSDAQIALDDVTIAEIPVDGLPVNGSTDYVASALKLPEPTDSWVGVCVVPVAQENNTANNCSSGILLSVEDQSKVVMPSILILLDDD